MKGFGVSDFHGNEQRTMVAWKERHFIAGKRHLLIVIFPLQFDSQLIKASLLLLSELQMMQHRSVIASQAEPSQTFI